MYRQSFSILLQISLMASPCMLYMYLCGLDVHNAKNVQDKSFVLDSHLEIIVYVHACICMIVESDLCLY